MPKYRVGFGLLAPPFILSALALIGWTWDVPTLKSGIVSATPMNPATAVCFILLCLETGRLIARNNAPFMSSAGKWLTWIVIAACAMKLSDVMLGTAFGIDTLLFSSKLSANLLQPNRMAPNTATCFLALGIALQLMRGGLDPFILLAQGLAVAILLVAAIAMTGYLYDVETFYKIGMFLPMAFNTIVAFIFLSGAILYSSPTERFSGAGVFFAGIETASLQAKILFWFLVIAILPLFINAFFNYQQAKARFEEEVFEGLQGFADRQARLIDDFVTERKADVSVFAEFPSAKESFAKLEESYAKGGVSSPAYLESEKKLQPIAQTILKYYDYKNIYFVSNKGDVIYSALPGQLKGTNLFAGPLKDSALSRLVKTAQETKSTEISSFAFYPQLKARVAMYLAAPIVQDEMAIGLLVLRMSPENVFLAIQSYKGLGETGELVLATQIGDEAVFVAPTRHDPDAAFKFRARIGSSRAIPALNAVQGQSGQGYSVDYRGQAVWAVWRYLPALKLGMVVKKDLVEINEQISPIKYFSSALTLLTILLALGVATRVAKSIAKPIERLTKATRVIAEGKLHERIIIQEQNEIGVLADSFNRMASHLENSYAKINSVVANAMDGIITIHVDGRIDAFNPAAERIFGYKADELVGKNISLLMPEPYRSEHGGHIQNYLRTGQAKVIGLVREIPALRKNGEDFTLEISVNETFLENQRLFTGIVRDITERKMSETLLKENEAKLNENERRLRSLIDNTPSVVYMKHADGRYILINKQFATLFKTTNEKVMGKLDTDLFPKDIATVFMENDRLVVESGESLYVEEAAPHDDGLHTYISVKFPLRNDLGNIYGMAGISTDITERKRIEEELNLHRDHLLELVDQKTQALRETNASLARVLREEKAVYDANPDILYVADTQGRLIKWNRKMEEVTGYSPDELMGKDPFSFFPPEEHDYIAKTIQKIFTEGKAEVEAHFLTKSGDLIPYHFHSIHLKNECNDVIGFTGTGRDVSERKRAEKALQQTQRQLLHAEKLSSLGKLTGSIAHEFNNPLYGMRLLLEEIADEAALDEAHKNNLSLAIRECDRMANLVRQLQGFYKPSTQNRVEISINQIVEEMLVLTQKKMKAKNIVLEKHLDPGLPTLKVVEDQIKQVVLNIIQNAEESIPAGRTDGKIIISTKNRGDEILIRFQDNGAGIPEEISSKIFEPFFTTKSAVKGTGLGLSVSHGIMEGHAGKIQVDSKPGEGSVFTLILPKNHQY